MSENMNQIGKGFAKCCQTWPKRGPNLAETLAKVAHSLAKIGPRSTIIRKVWPKSGRLRPKIGLSWSSVANLGQGGPIFSELGPKSHLPEQPFDK